MTALIRSNKLVSGELGVVCRSRAYTVNPARNIKIGGGGYSDSYVKGHAKQLTGINDSMYKVLSQYFVPAHDWNK